MVLAPSEMLLHVLQCKDSHTSEDDSAPNVNGANAAKPRCTFFPHYIGADSSNGEDTSQSRTRQRATHLMYIGIGSDGTVRTLSPWKFKQLAHVPMASLRQNQDPNPSEACTTLGVPNAARPGIQTGV